MGVGLVAIGSFSGVGLVAKSVGLKAINFGNQMWLLVYNYTFFMTGIVSTG